MTTINEMDALAQMKKSHARSARHFKAFLVMEERRNRTRPMPMLEIHYSDDPINVTGVEWSTVVNLAKLYVDLVEELCEERRMG